MLVNMAYAKVSKRLAGPDSGPIRSAGGARIGNIVDIIARPARESPHDWQAIHDATCNPGN
jgi:hypothetical protein